VLSVIIPAKNEAASIGAVVARLRERLPDAEVLVVDDGSTDDTARLARAAGATVVGHPQSLGNGAAVKSGVRHARGDWLLLMDADGQHDAQDVERLLAERDKGYSMVVGARGWSGQASVGRGLANGLYNRLASYMTGCVIPDLTSGMRLARADRFREFLHLLPNGFSYPTTITMAFFRSGYPVGYVPIDVRRRVGRSHIRPLRDGMRFLLIIFRIATLYSPLKLFVPAALVFFLLGVGNYVYTFWTEGRFTNMSALMLTTSVLVFLIGLLSEQITALMYRPAPDREPQRPAT
jgi:glycosyltransferase involved in cell wall biosynthesis